VTKTDADAVAALTSLAGVTDDNALEILLVARQQKSVIHSTRLNPTDRLARHFARIMRDRAREFQGKSLRQYSTGAMVAAGELMWVDAQTVPMLVDLASSLEAPLDLQLFDPQQSYARRVQLSVTAMTTATDEVVSFYQILRPSLRLSRSRRFGAILRGAAFDELTEEVLLFDERVDVVVAQQVAFFENRNSFERVFGFLEEIRAQAAEAFAHVTKELRIEGLAELEAACTTDVNMMAKMASIKRKLDSYPEYEQAMTMPKLLEFLADHPEAAVEVQENAGESSLVFHNDPQRRWKILKLLDDDYLASSLTSLKYEANSKSDPLP
jgi:hypothetical protein